ncbi:MAG: C45 family autoproteolytic acyltransferase/hydrolase [Rhodothermaceae bacterium]
MTSLKNILAISSILIMLLISFSCKTSSFSNENYLDKTSFKIPIIHLNKSSFENGFSRGKLLKDEIRENINLWKTELSKKFKSNPDSIINKFLNHTNYLPSINKWTPELYKELEGISKGAEIDFKTLFAFQLIDEFWTHEEFLANHHCTSLAINNFKITGEANYNAQTIDIPTYFHKNPVILKISSNNSSKLIVTFAGYLGINGINQNISVTENSLTKLKYSENGLPVTFVSRGILECKNFNDAVSFVKRVKHASGQNYIISSNKNIISLECSADVITEYWANDNMLYTFHGNNPLTNKSFNEEYKNLLIAFYGGVPKEITHSDPKLKTLEKYFSENNYYNKNSIKEILASSSICNSTTFLTTIMELGESQNRILILPKKSGLNEYFELSIEK